MRKQGELGYIGSNAPEYKGKLIHFPDLKNYVGKTVIQEMYRAGYPETTKWTSDLFLVRIEGYEENGHVSYRNIGTYENPVYKEIRSDQALFRFSEKDTRIHYMPESCCATGRNVQDTRYHYGGVPWNNFYEVA